jgi:hypothetical protein
MWIFIKILPALVIKWDVNYVNICIDFERDV